jgi:hypothetical protein
LSRANPVCPAPHFQWLAVQGTADDYDQHQTFREAHGDVADRPINRYDSPLRLMLRGLKSVVSFWIHCSPHIFWNHFLAPPVSEPSAFKSIFL